MKAHGTQDKQLRSATRKEAMQRRSEDQALNMKQFAVAAGISYSAARQWFRQPGFPAVCGVVFWTDFVEWRRHRAANREFESEAQKDQPQPPRPQSRAEWLSHLPPKARRIMEEFP